MGCVKLKSINEIELAIKELLEKGNVFSDVREEIDFIIELLKPLDKPNAPIVERILRFI